MPTYEYRCKSCGHQLEVQQSFTDAPLTSCPACAGALRKVFGNIAVTFKGSGFYKTDSRANGSKTSSGDAPAKSDTASDGSGGSSTSSTGSSGDTGGTSTGSGSSGGTSTPVAAAAS